MISKKVIEQSEFLKDIQQLLFFIGSEYPDIIVTEGEGERTEYQQKEYIRTGRSKTMNSKHLIRCAHDFNFYNKKTGKYIDNVLENKSIIKPIGDYWESLNNKNRWGGNFHAIFDMPHFERDVNL